MDLIRGRKEHFRLDHPFFIVLLSATSMALSAAEIKRETIKNGEANLLVRDKNDNAQKTRFLTI